MKGYVKMALVVCLLFGMFSCSDSYEKDDPVIYVDAPTDTTMLYISNDRIKLGVDLTLGGAVTYLSDELNGGENMVNSYDWGRQIQLSFYSGPWPFIGPNGEEPAPEWVSLGWNPIQSGDAGGNRSQTVFYEKRGDNVIFLRCIPMQWPHKTGVASECFFECLYTLKDNVIKMEASILNDRSDVTQYRASPQEMPAIYTNGPWYKLVTYLGDKPFTGQPTTTLVDKDDSKGWPWSHFYTPESWAALVDDSGLGVGVFQPQVMDFNGGFHPGDSFKGRGGEKDGQTGHIAPVGRQILDHNIRWTYTTYLILGTVDDVRSFALENRELNVKWEFTNSRESWYYDGGAKDSGYPIDGALKMQFNRNSSLVSPVTFWNASEAPVLEIEGAFTTSDGNLDVVVELQPFSGADLTSWLNWSEGSANVDEEKRIKKDKFPSKYPIRHTYTLVADGKSKKHRLSLTSISSYQGGMKSVKLFFNKPGQANITKIELGK
ncbi:MAG TPA: hypothetical protein GXZ56_05315 [Bacteroidales bacterium]|jgi:hypothetical protein|nr:hypothetical protein [Bacteroidales bacterium]